MRVIRLFIAVYLKRFIKRLTGFSGYNNRNNQNPVFVYAPISIYQQSHPVRTKIDKISSSEYFRIPIGFFFKIFKKKFSNTKCLKLQCMRNTFFRTTSEVWANLHFKGKLNYVYRYIIDISVLGCVSIHRNNYGCHMTLMQSFMDDKMFFQRQPTL